MTHGAVVWGLQSDGGVTVLYVWVFCYAGCGCLLATIHQHTPFTHARTHTFPFLSFPFYTMRLFFIFLFFIFHFSLYFYVQQKYPDTLLCRFLGLYTLSESSPQRSNKAGGGNTYHFVVMANVFDTDLDMQERFDLKGSVYQRTVGVSEHDQARKQARKQVRSHAGMGWRRWGWDVNSYVRRWLCMCVVVRVRVCVCVCFWVALLGRLRCSVC
jgi:hypothetical protein